LSDDNCAQIIVLFYDIIYLMSFRHKIPSLIAFILILVGFLVIMGWIFNVSFLRSINPLWTPMKFVTAVCFMMSGLIIFATNRIFHGEFNIAPLILSAGSLTIIILTSVFFASNIFNIPVGIEQLFIGEIFLKGKIYNLQPCTASMFNFLLIAIVGIMSMHKIKSHKKIILIVGILIGFIGLSSIIGHILRVPFLYFNIYGFSSAMSVISGPMFVLIGMVFYLLYACPLNNFTKVKNENQI